jgi:hypothetical protein
MGTLVGTVKDRPREMAPEAAPTVLAPVDKDAELNPLHPVERVHRSAPVSQKRARRVAPAKKPEPQGVEEPLYDEDAAQMAKTPSSSAE